MKRIIASAALVAFLTAPAVAQWATHDEAQFLHAAAQIKQMTEVVDKVRRDVQALPSSFQGTDVAGRLNTLSGILQSEQSACLSAKAGTAPPAICSVSNVARQQINQLATETAQIQSIKNAANGANGERQIGQAQANATIELATQMQELRALGDANALQKGIDAKTSSAAAHGPSAVTNPYATSGP